MERMETIESLIRTTLGEIEKLLSTKTIVGEPVTLDGRTIIPLISVGFGFGAGGGSGKGEAQKGEGTGGVSGGAAGIKPVAIIISDDTGVRVEPIKGSMASVVEKVGEIIPRSLEKLVETWAERRGSQKKEE